MKLSNLKESISDSTQKKNALSPFWEETHSNLEEV